jgi:tetratricopeptide (TPR) repeat protein
MATDQSINELLAEAAEALAEAGFRSGDFSTARDLAEKAKEEASRTSDTAGHARALNCLGMVAHYENITLLMSGSKPSSADIDSEEKLFRQALLRWQELGKRPAGEPSDAAGAGRAESDAETASAADAGTADTTAAATAGGGEAGGEAAAGDTAAADTPAAPTAGGEAAGGETAGGETAGGGPAAAERGGEAAGAAEQGGAAAGAGEHGTADAGTAQALFGLGLVFQVLHSDWMTAMPYFWQALDLVTKPDAAADLYLRSEVHRHVGFYFLVEDVRPPEAVRHLQLSLDLREELADPRRIPSGLQALGLAELNAGNRDRAVELLTRAVAEARAGGLSQQRIEDAEQDLREASGAPDAGTDQGPTDQAGQDRTEPPSPQTPGPDETEQAPADSALPDETEQSPADSAGQEETGGGGSDS